MQTEQGGAHQMWAGSSMECGCHTVQRSSLTEDGRAMPGCPFERMWEWGVRQMEGTCQAGLQGMSIELWLEEHQEVTL